MGSALTKPTVADTHEFRYRRLLDLLKIGLDNAAGSGLFPQLTSEQITSFEAVFDSAVDVLDAEVLRETSRTKNNKDLPNQKRKLDEISSDEVNAPITHSAKIVSVRLDNAEDAEELVEAELSSPPAAKIRTASARKLNQTNALASVKDTSTAAYYPGSHFHTHPSGVTMVNDANFHGSVGSPCDLIPTGYPGPLSQHNARDLFTRDVQQELFRRMATSKNFISASCNALAPQCL